MYNKDARENDTVPEDEPAKQSGRGFETEEINGALLGSDEQEATSKVIKNAEESKTENGDYLNSDQDEGDDPSNLDWISWWWSWQNLTKLQ